MALKDEKVELKAIFTSLMAALDVSDPHTHGHSERVGSLAAALGLELGLNSRELEILQDASVLHDIGKVGIRKEVLNKPGRLTPEEFEEVKQHVVFGYNILKPLAIPELLDITLYHHERIDGKGYPEGRIEIPLLVRVLQTADVWDALTSDRPYRPAMSYAEARELMDSRKNVFGFDPAIMETFLRLTRLIFPDVDVDPNEIAQLMHEINSIRVSDELGNTLLSS
jgi:putative two-component system response regulator